MREDIVNEIHKSARINFPRRTVVVNTIDELWQLDLVEMGPLSGKNSGFKFILTGIDCFSKLAFVRALKNKTGAVACAAVKSLFDEMNRTPTNIQTDLDKEFYNSSFSALMKTNNINHYSTHSHLKVRHLSIIIHFVLSVFTQMKYSLSYFHTCRPQFVSDSIEASRL